jgi:hypothetical protein
VHSEEQPATEILSKKNIRLLFVNHPNMLCATVRRQQLTKIMTLREHRVKFFLRGT